MNGLFTALLALTAAQPATIDVKETLRGSASSWSKEESGLVIADDQRGYDQAVQFVNSNLRLIVYEFPPYDSQCLYFFVFGGKHSGKMGGQVDKVERIVAGRTTRIQITVSVESAAPAKDSPWMLVKVMKKDLGVIPAGAEFVMLEKRSVVREAAAEELPARSK